MVMAGVTDHFEQMTIIKVYFIVEVLAVDYNFFWHVICIHRRQLEVFGQFFTMDVLLFIK